MEAQAAQSSWHKVLSRLVTGVALLMIAYHVLIVWYPLFGELMNQNTHLGFCLVLLFLHWARGARGQAGRAACLAGAGLGLILVIYMALNYERLDMEAGFPEPRDVLVGVGLIFIVLLATWRSFGATFPVLVLLAMAYAFWGQYLPGVMRHPPLEFGYIISNLSVGFQGIYGMLLNVSVNILFLLVIFGSIFAATGVTRFFMEFGAFLGRHLRGGAGLTAVFSSSFVGMANGVAVANVAITGSYTIPVMKKSGFSPAQAAAIEAMASTGGQLTPPIMGIAVFIMANFLGTSYADLMGKALLPAIAYYALAVAGVMLIASREAIPRPQVSFDRKVLLGGAPVFLVPMTVLTVVLMLHYSVANAAFWGIASLLAVSYARPSTRPAPAQLLQGLVSGAVLGATFGAAVGCIGILVKCMTFTGLATKLSLLITSLAGAALLPTLVMTMLLSILLSSSTPTVIAYVVVAFLAAPIITDLGVSRTVAHLFVFYFAIMAAVTPPVAGAAMVGSQLAGARYLKASWESFKLVGPFFLLPYFLVHNPVIMSQSQPWPQAVMALVALVLAMGTLLCFAQRYCLTHLGRWESLGFLAAAILATGYGLYGQAILFAASLLLSALVLAGQWRKRRARQPPRPERRQTG